jgi:transcriptional regulator with XRE-family HTH domain
MRAITEALRQGYAGDLTTLTTLQNLAGFSTDAAARACMVSPETYRRWRSDRKANPTAVRLLAILAGYVPWPGWDGWEIHNGYLFPPGLSRGGLSPGQVWGYPFSGQLLSATRARVRELEQRVAAQHEQLAAYGLVDAGVLRAGS